MMQANVRFSENIPYINISHYILIAHHFVGCLIAQLPVRLKLFFIKKLTLVG